MSKKGFMLDSDFVTLTFSVILHHSWSITIFRLLTPPPPLSVTDQTKHEQKPGETGNRVVVH